MQHFRSYVLRVKIWQCRSTWDKQTSGFVLWWAQVWGPLCVDAHREPWQHTRQMKTHFIWFMLNPNKKSNAAGKLFPYCRCTFLIFFFSNPFLLFVCAAVYAAAWGHYLLLLWAEEIASHRGKGMNIELLVNEPQVRLHVLLVVGK